MQCPGSVAAEAAAKSQGEDDSNPASRLGTVAHALLEEALIWGYPPELFIGCYLLPEPHPPVDEAMCNAVQVAIDYVEEYRETYGRNNIKIRIEYKLEKIGSTFLDPDDADACSGTTDILLMHNDMSMCNVADYKHGSGVMVEARENPQLMLYAAGAFAEFGKFKKYRGTVIQPRVAKRRPIDEWEFTHATLLKFINNTVRPAAVAALLPNAPRNAGEHCRWCRAAPSCKTYRAKARAIAGSEFDPIETDADLLDPDSFGPEDYARLLLELPILKAWIKTVEARALRMAQAGTKIEGFKLGWGKRTRQWDSEAAVVAWCKRKKLNPEDYSPRGLLSPSELTKLIKKKKIVETKRGEEFVNPLDAFIKYSIPAPKVVPVGGSEFDEIDDE